MNSQMIIWFRHWKDLIMIRKQSCHFTKKVEEKSNGLQKTTVRFLMVPVLSNDPFSSADWSSPLKLFLDLIAVSSTVGLTHSHQLIWQQCDLTSISRNTRHIPGMFLWKACVNVAYIWSWEGQCVHMQSRGGSAGAGMWWQSVEVKQLEVWA